MKKVLILSSSPRKGGNSDLLCDAFAKGAKAAGNEVEKIRVAEKKIGYCTGCYACRKTGVCVQKDDARAVLDKMMAADVIVLATPVYFYTMCAQLKTLIDRSVVIFPKLTNKTFYYLTTMAETDAKMLPGTLNALQGFLDCYEGSKLAGKVCATGVYEKGAVKGTKWESAAEKLGASVK